MKLFILASLATAATLLILAIAFRKAGRERKHIKTWRSGRVE